MKKMLTSSSLVLMLALAFSCQNHTAAGGTGKVAIGHLQYHKTAGADCDKPDTLRFDCITIELSWPKLEDGSNELKNSVSAWANAFIVGMISPETDTTETMAIDQAAAGFIQSQKDMVKEAPGSPMGQWAAESTDTVLLNDGQYLTLEINGYTYAGGAHGSPSAAVGTFAVATGKKLQWDDLVTDKAALKSLAEKKFRVTQSEAFKEGFDFDDIFQFDLPGNYGLVKDGIYFHYVVYEVTPYVFGETTFVIPFSELGALSKIKK